jgi:hypothetical protein
LHDRAVCVPECRLSIQMLRHHFMPHSQVSRA